ncbi:MAG: ribose 5-phosphate isomerase [Clostridiales bacterium]|jgi:ribose 5-phosphate isomerase B|nr:ribose 5-phosphate isomerase [Clostridiales bacterium]
MIAIGCDPAGYDLKCGIIKHLEERGIEYKDFGCYEGEKCDYPVVAKKVCDEVVSKKADKALLFCGTGIGISMAANKVKGIRAAACSDYYSAKYTRLHNDANVLCLGGRVVGIEYACELVDVFLDTGFEGGRHQRRVDQITAIENEEEING